MARRKRNDSIAHDLFEIASSLPWKWSLGIALISYFFFHHFASQPVPTGTDLESITGSLSDQIFRSFSLYLQYIVPGIFILGACVSAFKSRNRAELLERQSSIESIRALTWQEFELLVGEAFKRRGYEVHENGGGGADGGIDLILYKNGRKSIVQCKRWRTSSVNVSLVRELYGVMTAENASECILVSSGSYTSEARLFAESKPVWLIDGPELLELVAKVHSTPDQIKTQQPRMQQMTQKHCPLCGSAMVLRVAKKGANVGSEFWGCSRFPSCKGTR